MTHFYVISFDPGEAKPYGFAWFAEISPRNRAFTYYHTYAEAKAQAATRPGATCLSDDTKAEAEA